MERQNRRGEQRGGTVAWGGGCVCRSDVRLQTRDAHLVQYDSCVYVVSLLVGAQWQRLAKWSALFSGRVCLLLIGLERDSFGTKFHHQMGPE